MGLDCDSAFAFQVHAVQDLIAKVSVRNAVRKLKHAIRQGGFAMVDVRNNAEIANKGDIFHGVAFMAF